MAPTSAPAELELANVMTRLLGPHSAAGSTEGATCLGQILRAASATAEMPQVVEDAAELAFRYNPQGAAAFRYGWHGTLLPEA